MKGIEAKRNYIETACQIMHNQGVEAVSARKIAVLTGTAPSAVYRHFHSMDELIVYASIRYRYTAYQAMDQIALNARNGLEMYRETETGFARFAFSNPVLFNGLVFGAYSDDMPAIWARYREIFPETPEAASSYAASVLAAQEFSEGNLCLLSRCVEDGSLRIPADELDDLNSILVNMFKGFLKTALDRPGLNPEALAQDYIRCFARILRFYAPDPAVLALKP